MIWQLVKRNIIWQTLWIAAVLLPGTALVTHASLVPLATILFGSGLGALHSSRTVYQSALPISAEDLWVAQVLSFLSFLWLPVLPAAAILFAKGDPALPLLLAAAFNTVVLAAFQCIQLLTDSQWTRLIGFLCMPLVITAAENLRLSPRATVFEFALCGAAAGTLLLLSWSRIPQASEFVRGKSRGSISASGAPASPHPYWWALLKSVSLLDWIFLATTLWLQAFLGASVFVVVLAVFLPQLRERFRWLAALPFSRRVQFAFLTLPFAGAIALGSVANVFIGAQRPLAPQVRVAELAAEAGAFYLAIFFFELVSWSRLSRLPAWLRSAPLLLLFAGMLAAESLHRLLVLLPGAAYMVAALCATLLLAYWLAEKAFREQEYSNTRAMLRERAGG